jgi:3-oxoadipate enol-lactonase
VTRRRLVAVVAAMGILAAALLAGGVALTRHPKTALEAWRTADMARFGARTGTVTLASGERIAYAELGPERGPVLALVHGLRGESTVMLPLASALADAGYRVIAPDFPGHGRSDPPAVPLTIGRAGEVVLEVLEARGAPEPRAWIGHSMGGWTVAWTALSEPGRCRDVVLISSGGMRFEPPPLPVLMPDNLEDARRSLPYLFHDPPDPPDFLLSIAAARPMTGSMQLLRSALSGEYLLKGLLPGMTSRTLVLWGAEDRLIPPETGRRMAAAIPGAEYVVIEAAGHMVVWSKPRETADAILAFLGNPAAATEARGGAGASSR